MKKIVPTIFSLLTLCGVSFGQIQISGGGTNNLVFTVLQDISFQIDSDEAWGYTWGVKVADSLTSGDGYQTQGTLVSGTGPGGVLLGGTSPFIWNYDPISEALFKDTANPVIEDIRIGAIYDRPSSVNNGVFLEFSFGYVDFGLSAGSIFTLRQGSYEREWVGAGNDQNTLVSPGTTYTITKDNFFSFSEQGANLDTSKISLVPEPSALSLLAVGLGGLAMMRRRRS
jgi:hypothetical protein